MKVKNNYGYLILVIIAMIIVIIGMLLGNKKETKSYENLTDEQYLEQISEEFDEFADSELIGADERTRMQRYVGNFIRSIDATNYEDAYELLYEKFRDKYFPTVSSFEEYAKYYFSDNIACEYTNFERNGDYYILWVTMYNPVQGKNLYSVDMNFVIKENELNDYVLSFSVDTDALKEATGTVVNETENTNAVANETIENTNTITNSTAKDTNTVNTNN